jgi:hypothetical protein
MASSFEKSVKGGTKIKVCLPALPIVLPAAISPRNPLSSDLLTVAPHQLAAPKSKYVEHILVATHAGEAGVAEIFRALTNRLRDSTWTIVFKSLIIVHLMIREGEPEVTLKYLAQNPSRKLAINHFTEGMLNLAADIRRLAPRRSLEWKKFQFRKLFASMSPVLGFRLQFWTSDQRSNMREMLMICVDSANTRS